MALQFLTTVRNGMLDDEIVPAPTPKRRRIMRKRILREVGPANDGVIAFVGREVARVWAEGMRAQELDQEFERIAREALEMQIEQEEEEAFILLLAA